MLTLPKLVYSSLLHPSETILKPFRTREKGGGRWNRAHGAHSLLKWCNKHCITCGVALPIASFNINNNQILMLPCLFSLHSNTSLRFNRTTDEAKKAPFQINTHKKASRGEKYEDEEERTNQLNYLLGNIFFVYLKTECMWTCTRHVLSWLQPFCMAHLYWSIWLNGIRDEPFFEFSLISRIGINWCG